MSACDECRMGDAIRDEAKARGLEVVLTPVPTPRHAWGDVASCPVCGRSWLVDVRQAAES